jgi:hypothetical protein
MTVIELTPGENANLDRLALRHDRPHKFTLYAELSATSNKSWLVRDLLGEAEASAVYGAPGSGKSALVEDMALHIAAGWDWHGKAVKQGAVVYVALERRKLVERRAIAWRVRHGITELPFVIVGGIMDLKQPQTAKAIAEICRQVEELTGVPVVLIIVDTLSRALAGGDENSPKDIGAIVNATAGMQAATAAHVMWLHHVPHDGDRMRGHGALLGAMDTTLHVVKGDNTRRATVVKANDSEEGATITFTLESVEIGADGTTAPVVVPTEATAAEPAGPKLTKNQQTLFGILHSAGGAGLTTEEWNSRGREQDIGARRKADLYDIREALRSKGLVLQAGDRWLVNHS